MKFIECIEQVQPERLCSTIILVLGSTGRHGLPMPISHCTQPFRTNNLGFGILLLVKLVLPRPLFFYRTCNTHLSCSLCECCLCSSSLSGIGGKVMMMV